MSTAAAPEATPKGPQEGDEAPDFSLQSTPDQWVRLDELEGPVVLIFYPADWSPVCSDELSMFEAALHLFEAKNAQVIGISVDSTWSHLAFKAERHLSFPLLADFNPKGAVARDYGIFREHDDTSERATFVLDAEHRVAWRHVSPVGVNPGVDGALRVVESLS